MANNADLGRQGEDLAFHYLVKKGYTIKERNWRFKHEEIDLIAKKNNKLIIVEVKTRSAAIFENMEEAIGLKKIRSITNAADAYIFEKEIDMETQFDVISIKWFGKGKYQLEHIQDAFSPPVC